MSEKKRQPEAPEPTLVGILAQYAGPDELLEACEKARDAGYKKMDAYVPFPLHGMDEAIGIQRTKLPFFVLAVGLSACAFALLLQWFTNATDDIGPFTGYKYNISGKPYFGIPANIPVTFEITVLLSAFASFFGMWGLNRLPRLSNPLLKSERFRRVTNDGFFLMIEQADSRFDESEVTQRLNDWGAVHLEQCIDDIDKRMPPIFKTIGLLVLTAMLIPPVMIYKARYAKNDLPRMHFNPDMDRQYKYKEQVESPTVEGKFLFADGRASRPPIPGTIARGEILDHDLKYGYPPGDEHVADVAAAHTAAGFVSTIKDGEEGADPGKVEVPEPEWLKEFPLPVTEQLMERGHQRFNIYCVVCHGYAGDGNGRVAERAAILNATGKAAWVAPKSLHDPTVSIQPVGRIYDTISNGRGAMGPYGSQIVPQDRWAIALYVKALQKTRKFDEQAEVPAGVSFETVPYIGLKPQPEQPEDGEKEMSGEATEKQAESDNKEKTEKTD